MKIKYIIILLLFLILFSCVSEKREPENLIVFINEKEIKVFCDYYWLSEEEHWGRKSYELNCYLNMNRIFKGYSNNSIYVLWESNLKEETNESNK